MQTMLQHWKEIYLLASSSVKNHSSQLNLKFKLINLEHHRKQYLDFCC